ncbi:DNA repair protein [Streptomyces hygroscopicus subsp. limoneus]|nr:DNA repair protein [Streptomyces hygroscopicus subsp. limoneus]
MSHVRTDPAGGTARSGLELITFGHGTAGRTTLAELLREAGVAAVVDVRTAPGSRRDPDLSRQRLAEWMPEERIAYRWERRLGGWRKPPPDSPDTVWRNESFRGYAAHTRSAEFVTAMDGVLRQAGEERTAVMCGEAVWWRCHRRLIADFAVLARGALVLHLMHDGRLMAHSPTPGVRLRGDGLLVYDDGPRAAG